MGIRNTTALRAVTTTGAGEWIDVDASLWQASAWLDGAGGTASITIEVREGSGAPVYSAGTLTLSGANARDQFKVVDELWKQARFNVTALSAATVNGNLAQDR